MEPVVLTALCRPRSDLPGAGTLAQALYRDLLAAIRDGRLPADSLLPSSRAAALALGLSRNTVNTAYDLLRAEGVVVTRAGAAPRVARLPAGGAVQARPATIEAPPLRPSARGVLLADNPRRGTQPPPGPGNTAGQQAGLFMTGTPDEALFPSKTWARHLRMAAGQRYGGAACYEDTQGFLPLREVLARRLQADRGVQAEPSQLLITSGTQASLTLLAQVLTSAGDTVLLEDPGYMGARAAFQGAGLQIAPLPVDDDGANPDAVDPATLAAARLIYVTPSNQYPLGRRMSLPRRLSLLAEARRSGALVLEDDYDSEFQWRGREIASLHALGRGQEVAYLGTASKALLPGLRLAWLVVPAALVEPLRAAQRNMGLLANLHAQAALAGFIDSGGYRAHLRLISREYARRGAALAEALTSRFGDALEVRLPDGGLHLCARFRGAVDEHAAVSTLARAGYRPGRLSGYGFGGGAGGLVIGFSDARRETVQRFCDTLAEAL